MMQPYSEYKNTEIDWLETIPKNWKLVKLKHVSSLNMGQSPSSDDVNQEGEGIPFIQGNAEFGALHPTPKNFCTEPSKICKPDDILISVRAPVGALNISDQKYVIGRGLSAITPESVRSGFCWYALQNSKYQLSVMETGTTFKAISGSDLANVFLPLPSQEEQRVIEGYLNFETSRIDRLITEKAGFIDLLKEKRQALISHVVTKGLDPEVEMRDSGVEWIGEIPKHWRLKKLRYLGRCQNGINIGGEFFGEGYPFISYGDVYKNRQLPEKAGGLVRSSDSDRLTYTVKEGDVLFTRTSETIAEIGFSSVCMSDMTDAVFAGFLIRFRPNIEAINKTFSKYYFQNELLRAFFVKEMNIVTRASLSQELLKRMPVVLPPEEEQVLICQYMDKKNEALKALIEESKRSIDLLKERRTALISAAVTGKIDLRDKEVA